MAKFNILFIFLKDDNQEELRIPAVLEEIGIPADFEKELEIAADIEEEELAAPDNLDKEDVFLYDTLENDIEMLRVSSFSEAQ